MNLIVSGKQMDVGDALRQHIEGAIKGLTEKYIRVNPTSGVVSLHKERHLFFVDIQLHLSSGLDIFSHDKADDVYAAFDLARDHLERSLRKYSKRINDYHDKQKASELQHDSVAQQYVLSEQFGAAEEESEAELAPLVIAETTMKIDQMTVKDAVMRLELSNNPIVVFKNANNAVINVVYRRQDGNIGWVDPK